MTIVVDDFLYQEDAIEVGIILFGERTCACCHAGLPSCTDYYAPDRSRPDGLVYECRRCRRELERSRYVAQRRQEVIASGQLDLLTASQA